MKIVKIYLPVTKAEEKNGKVLIEGQASDTGKDYDKQRCSKEFIKIMADTVNQAPGGIGCFPDHDFRASNLAARHYEAKSVKTREGKGLLLRSELNPAHPNFEYWKHVFLENYPIQYSITVINPVIAEGKNGEEIIDGGELKTVDFVAIGANPRTWVRLQKGGFEVIEKGPIPYSVHGDSKKAEEDYQWDAAKEVRNSEVEDLEIMCTWYREPGENKGDYKLPHHRQSDKAVVWRGVSTAMAALFGARGGVKIPNEDKRGVYNHLKKHYGQFDRQAPEFKEFKEYTEDELTKIFPELYSEEDENMTKEEKTADETTDNVLEAVQKLAELSAEQLEKEGRTLNAANKQKLTQAIKLIRAVLGDTEEEKSAGEKLVEMSKKIADMSKEIEKLKKQSNGRSSGTPNPDDDPIMKEYNELDEQTKKDAEWAGAIFGDLLRKKRGG